MRLPPLPCRRGLATDLENVYISGTGSQLYALLRQTGSELWQHELLKNRDITGPTAYQNSVVVGDFEGYVHFLDLRTATWSAGPPMLEARAEHDAMGLPDGSVLVTGGWTKKADWGKGPSATAERWNPATNRFEAVAPMPTGTALHRGFWLPGQEGKSLLITQGMSNTAQAYDLATQTWRTVGSWGEGEQAGAWPMPFTFDGNTYAWRLNRAQCHDSNKDCMEHKYYSLTLQGLFDALARRERRNDTLTIIVADHGDGLGDHDFFGHAFVAYEELVHVPLIVHWPGRVEPNTRVETPVSTRRVFHTIIDAAAAGQSEALDAILEDDAPNGDR